jgi:hypothetical protein
MWAAYDAKRILKGFRNFLSFFFLSAQDATFRYELHPAFDGSVTAEM